MSKVNVTINGIMLQVDAGIRIMSAAGNADIYIPGICSHPDLPPGGVCGLCVVEVVGRPEPVHACETPVEEGMVINTETPALQSIRREKLSAILATHPHACLTCAQQEGCSRTQCSSNVPENERCCPNLGQCELQKVAQYIGIKGDTPRYYFKNLPIINQQPLFSRNLNLCIGCQRCVRVCRDVRGVDALKLVEMEGKTVVTTVSETLPESGCRFCTACVKVCPTGALADKDYSRGISGEAALVPCRSDCPAGIDIPRFIRLITEERFDESLAVIREKVPFPASLGRVCFHPCEENCRRGQIDEPVSICRLKWFAADKDTGRWREKMTTVQPTGKRVAVVGSGPAGMTAAYNLARRGHTVTVFEALPYPGGMMRVGIPAYRLPRNVLEQEIASIEKAGVEIRTGRRIENIDNLFAEGFQAVFVSTGAHRPVELEIPGENRAGVLKGVEFLRRVALGEFIPVGEQVAVIGGGNVAMDCARTALRLGAKKVSIIYRRTETEITAIPEEINSARYEGVEFSMLVSPVNFKEKAGRVCAIECVRNALGEPDAGGRRRPVPIAGSEFTVEADTVIVAVGQKTDGQFIGYNGINSAHNGLITVDAKTLATDKPGVFAGGDVVSGPASVIEAVAAGRKAASSIDRFLGGSGNIDEALIHPEVPDGYLGKDEDFLQTRRHGLLQRPWQQEKGCAAGECPPQEVLVAKFGEVEQVFDELMAVQQASRCLQCDLRTYLSEVPLPPQRWLDFNGKNISAVPETEGIYQLLDDQKNVIAIVGTATLRQSLLEQLEEDSAARYFIYEEDPMYTQRESQLMQQFLQQHGHLPEGNDELDDLF